MYVFPPFGLVAPVLCFLRGSGVTRCTMVVPAGNPTPFWWPVLWRSVVDSVQLGRQGQRTVLLYPSKSGFAGDTVGLPCDLWAVRVRF